jgi:uncharacterized protein YcgI (DUF1989 family)
MPLLMLEPSHEPLPAIAEIVVPPGGVRALALAQGQLLAVTDLEGGQPAPLFAVAADDMQHLLSPHHTRVFSNSFLLRLGMRLVSNRRRPMMVLGRDAVLAHDLLMPITNGAKEGDTDAAHRFRGSVFAAFAAIGVQPSKIADPINLFLDVGVETDGHLRPRGAPSAAGATVVLRVLMDLAVAVAAPHPDPRLWARASAGSLRMRAVNWLDEL